MLISVSIVARNANVPGDNNGYCSSNEVFGVDVRFGEHVPTLCAAAPWFSFDCCGALVR